MPFALNLTPEFKASHRTHLRPTRRHYQEAMAEAVASERAPKRLHAKRLLAWGLAVLTLTGVTVWLSHPAYPLALFAYVAALVGGSLAGVTKLG